MFVQHLSAYIDHTGMLLANAGEVPDTCPDQGPVEPRPDDAGVVPLAMPVQASPGLPHRQHAN